MSTIVWLAVALTWTRVIKTVLHEVFYHKIISKKKEQIMALCSMSVATVYLSEYGAKVQVFKTNLL